MVVYSVKDYLKWNKGVNKNIDKVINERSSHRYYCKCGHTVIIRPCETKILCHWCNRYVFKNEKDEFLYRMKEAMK